MPDREIKYTLIAGTEVDVEELRNEVAKAVHRELMVGLGGYIMNSSKKVIDETAKGHAKVAWLFADEFMRERYERSCVKASGVDLSKLTVGKING